MAGKTVAVLGGGIGGVVVANRLRRLLGREHRVALVDRSPIHSFPPSFLWVMLSRRDPGRISRDLSRLRRKGIDFICSEVKGIDLEGRQVVLQKGELTWDYLVVALGAQYSAQEIPGLGTAFTYYTLEGADGLREELEGFKAGRIVIVVSSLPYRCPAAPYEGALLLDDHFRRRRLRDQVEISLYTPEPFPLPVAGEALGEQVIEMLRSRGIGFHPQMRLKSVDPRSRRLSFQDGAEAPYDLLIATPVHRVPDVVCEAGLAQQGGWVPVDRETLATQFEGVYALGDITHIPLAHGLPLPKAGVFAHGEAEVVARNIAAEIKGLGERWAFGGEGACFLETELNRAAYAEGRFFAEPTPQVKLYPPGVLRHWAKVGFERLWLWRWF